MLKLNIIANYEIILCAFILNDNSIKIESCSGKEQLKVDSIQL